jgi:hypothetical protein
MTKVFSTRPQAFGELLAFICEHAMTDVAKAILQHRGPVLRWLGVDLATQLLPPQLPLAPLGQVLIPPGQHSYAQPPPPPQPPSVPPPQPDLIPDAMMEVDEELRENLKQLATELGESVQRVWKAFLCFERDFPTTRELLREGQWPHGI